MEELLPEELIIRIFERLPIKPLIRFTCLSTRWRFVILTDPHFAKSQLLIASQNHTLTPPRLLAIFNPHFQFQVQSNVLGDNNPGRFRELQLPFTPPDDIVTGICSSNGLVCVAFGTDIYIWNPSTGRHTTLPHISSQLAGIDDIGFGYVSSLDDYKVVANVEDNEDEDEYHIFSWRAQMWKKMLVPPRCCRSGDSESTLSNESIHWLLDDGDYVGVFDLAKEEFRTMLLPRSIRHKWDRDRYRGLILGASLGGSLYLLHGSYGAYADLWVLKEYGVTDSWCKLNSFQISMIPERLFFVMGTIFVAAEDVERGNLMLIRCGHEGEEVLKICRVNENSYGVIEYQETLLWLP